MMLKAAQIKCGRGGTTIRLAPDGVGSVTDVLADIVGQYKVSEDLRRDPLWGASVQVNLSGDVLNIIRL